jgi:hypothetical protein
MQFDGQTQPKYTNKKVILILLGVVILSTYLGGVFIASFSASKTQLEIPYLVTLKHKCSLSNFDMAPSGRAFNKSGFRQDANVWLWESHANLMFTRDILSDSTCLGALLADVSNLHYPIVIVIYDPVRKETVYRIERK